MVNMICFNCMGNGFIKLSWEGEQAIEQCKVCKSTGKLDPKKHYHQTWSEGVDNTTNAFYYGPPLDGSSFKNYKIYDSS